MAFYAWNLTHLSGDIRIVQGVWNRRKEVVMQKHFYCCSEEIARCPLLYRFLRTAIPSICPSFHTLLSTASYPNEIPAQRLPKTLPQAAVSHILLPISPFSRTSVATIPVRNLSPEQRFAAFRPHHYDLYRVATPLNTRTSCPAFEIEFLDETAAVSAPKALGLERIFFASCLHQRSPAILF